jgi:glycosyl transferase family 25
MRAFLINLDKDGTRLARVTRECAAAAIDCERFPAVDGRRLAPLSDHSTGGMMTQGATGCFLSHRTVWQRIAALAEPALILEDDISLRSDARSRIEWAMAAFPTCDVLMLECSERAYWSPGDCVFAGGDRVADGLVRLGRNRSLMSVYARNRRFSCIPGSRAYVATPLGATKLLRYRSAPADVVLAAAVVSDAVGFAFSPPLAFLSPEHDGISNTAG